MNASQRAALARLMKRYTQTKSASPAKARAALIAEGIYTRRGKISAAYGGENAADQAAKKR